MFTKIETNQTQATQMRKLQVANQNSPTGLGTDWSPQWYDVKNMVERMFDARSRVRDAIEKRKEAEGFKRRYSGHPSRQIVVAEIHGHNMQIALAWHDYRKAAAAYHYAWNVYRKNLRKF